MFNTRADADAHHIVRQKHDIARRPWDAYWIYREIGSGMWCKYDDREFVSRTGDLFISDADLPFETRTSTRYAYESWLVPKALLDPYLPALGRPLLRQLDRRGGVGALAANYLETLTRNAEDIPDASLWKLVDTLARLLGIACGAGAAEQGDAVRTGRLVEAKRYIDRHLADPELSTASTAASLGVSVRTLHQLFEPDDISFARHVLRRRLEECRTALLGDPARPVIDIAFAWGFNSLSTFYRTFQSAFGMSPGDLRGAARDARYP
jgi:AraC-like DNA-binding protein